MIYVMAMIWSLVIGVIVSVGFVYFPHIWQRWLTFLITSIIIGLINLAVIHKGNNNMAAWTLSVTIWLFITIPCLTSGGIWAPGILSQLSVILTAGFLLGWRGGLLFGILSMFTDLGFAIMEIKGILPEPSVHHTPISRWIGAIIPFGTILALQYYSTSHLNASLERMTLEIRKREEMEKDRHRTLKALEERVKELKALCDVSSYLQNSDDRTAQTYIKIAETIRQGWQYPDITAARVIIDEENYSSANYKSSQYVQEAGLKSSNGTYIGVEVLYLEEKPEMDEGPFLKEERTLINAIAELLCRDQERQETLRELNDYKYAIDMANIIGISGVDGKFSYVNDNFCKISKYESQELIGKDYSILWSENNITEDIEEINRRLSAGEHVRHEFRSKAKDGSYYWIDATIVPFLDENNNVYQYLSIIQDITESKESEEKIRQNEKLLKKITSQVPGNTYMFEIEESGNTNLLFINKGTDRFNHKFSFEELYDDAQKLHEVVHKDDKQKFIEMFRNAYKTNEPINFQYRIDVNGVIRWRWMQGVPEINSDGSVVWFAATSDITPLVEYIATIEQMIFDVSHVLRRPITNLLGIAYLISDNKLSTVEGDDLIGFLNKTTNEIDQFLVKLNESYSQKRKIENFNIDVETLLDKRSSFFRQEKM